MYTEKDLLIMERYVVYRWSAEDEGFLHPPSGTLIKPDELKQYDDWYMAKDISTGEKPKSDMLDDDPDVLAEWACAFYENLSVRDDDKMLDGIKDEWDFQYLPHSGAIEFTYRMDDGLSATICVGAEEQYGSDVMCQGEFHGHAISEARIPFSVEPTDAGETFFEIIKTYLWLLRTAFCAKGPHAVFHLLDGPTQQEEIRLAFLNAARIAKDRGEDLRHVVSADRALIKMLEICYGRTN